MDWLNERRLLELTHFDDLLLAASHEDNDLKILAVVEGGLDLANDLLVLAVGTGGQVEVILGVTRVGEEGDGAIVTVDVEELVLSAGDVGDIHVVGGRAHIFVLLAGEDVVSHHVSLGVTVLSGLGSGEGHDLAWLALQKNEHALLDFTSTNRDGQGGVTTTSFEIIVLLRSHGDD